MRTLSGISPRLLAQPCPHSRECLPACAHSLFTHPFGRGYGNALLQVFTHSQICTHQTHPPPHTHTLTHTHTHSLTHTLSHSLTHSLTHTHTHARCCFAFSLCFVLGNQASSSGSRKSIWSIPRSRLASAAVQLLHDVRSSKSSTSGCTMLCCVVLHLICGLQGSWFARVCFVCV